MPISVAGDRAPRGVAVPLRAVVRSALALEGRTPGEIAVVLTTDPALRELNRVWRGLDRATDVLSFGYDDPPAGPASRAARPRAVHGDLVVSMDRMREQARRFRVTRGRELARLVVHGALHLAGLEHHAAAERRAMRAQEDRALRALRPAIAALDRVLSARAGGRVA